MNNSNVIPVVGMDVEYIDNQKMKVVCVDTPKKSFVIAYDNPGTAIQDLLCLADDITGSVWRPFSELVKVDGKVIWNHE